MKSHVALAAFIVAATPAVAQTAPVMAPMSPEQFRQTALITDTFEIESSRLALARSRDPAVRSYAQMMITDHQQTSAALNGGAPVVTGTLGGAATGAVIGGVVGGPVGAAVGAGVGASTGAAASGAAPAGTLGGAATGAVVGGVVGGPVGAAVGAGVGAGAGATADAAATGSVHYTAGNLLDARHADMLNQLAAARGAQFDRMYARMQLQGHQEAVAMYAAYAQAGTDPAMRSFAAQALPHLEHHLADARRLTGRRG